MSPLVVGLTGGVASGKTRAALHLAKLGAYIIDADQIAREVAEDPQIKSQLKVCCPQAFDNDRLNRSAMRKIVFSSNEELRRLNLIMHPAIIHRFLQEVRKCKEPVCIVVAPLLVETGLHQNVDEVWVIHAPVELQLERLIKRDKISREDAVKMVDSQLPNAEKLAVADTIIDNSGSIEKMKSQLEKAWQTVLKKLASRPGKK